ncbi:hypothetical protein FRC02_012289 [Tulasnella sp. 418]|nr:hypothetical protein FRC02_012289 [Tulasnella sp. 418]
MVADPQLVHLVSALLRTNYERLKSETILYGDLDGSLKVESLDDPGRIVAIVVNDESGREEGSLFVLKYADHAAGSLKIELVIPILEDFVFTLGQANHDTSERDGDEETREGMYISGEMQVTFGGAGQSVTLRTVAREAIRSLSVESRRLKAIAEKNRFIENGSHSWLRLYTTRRSVNRVFSYEQYLRSAYPPPKLSIAYAGMPGDELTDSELICDEWIRGQLHNRLGEYGTTQSISIRLGTFNVNGKDPSGTLSSWIGCGDNKERPLPDVLVFGFQELDLSAEALLYSTSTLKEEKWCKAILDNLGQDADSYVKLTSKQLVGMLIFVLVRKTLRHHISEISSASSGQGAMWLGNKGGVALRLRIYDTVFVFVNSHLAAFDNMVERRNADYSELRRLLRFPLPPDLFGEPSMFGPNAGVFDSDFTFWMVSKCYYGDQDTQS